MLGPIVQMGPMVVLAALVVGWTAEAVSHVGGYGLLPDMGIGLIGSAMAGGLFWFAVSGNTGMLLMLLIGAAGATFALAAQRTLWRPIARLAVDTPARERNGGG